MFRGMRLYQVSNLSRVKSLDKFTNVKGQSKRFMPSKIMKPNFDSKGYLKYNFYTGEKIKTMRLHQLVANAFIDNPEELPFVRHLNDIKTDNRLENLAFGNREENTKDAIKNGKFPKGENSIIFGKVGELCPYSKLILDTQTGIFYYGTSEAAKAKNLVQSTLKSKLNGRIKTNNTSLIYC